MRKRLGVVAVIVAIAAIVGLVSWKRGGDDTAEVKPAATAGSSTTTARTLATREVAEPARVSVVVSGAQGPLAGATVRMSRAGRDVFVVQTGADGVAQSEPLEPATWTFSASADGHEPAAIAPRELVAGETVRIELTLAAGGRVLSGVVTDVMGGPIAGARIDAAKLAAMARPGDAVASTLTGADGTYSLSVAEGQLLVAASEASYAPQSRYVDVGPSGAIASFQLVPGGVIEGVVRDEKTREPVVGAQVSARRDAPAMPLGERARLMATTGADGRFRLAGLRPGGYNLAARAASSISRGPTTIGLGVAEQITDVEILVAGAPSIRGVVVDEKGTPVAGLDIDAFTPGRRGGGEIDRKSDAQGQFVIEGVQPGRYVLVARGPGHLPAGATRVEVDTKDVDGVKVSVRAGSTLVGHVEPRQVCEVTVEGNDDRPMLMTFIPPQMTKADGAFSLGPVDMQPMTVEARCPSGAQGTKQATPGSEIVVEVKPGASIAGRVVDGAGKPVAAVTVMGSPIGGAERTTIVNGMVTSGIQTLTNGQGAFELRGLAAGSYRLGVLERGRPLPSKGEDLVVAVAAAEKKTGVTVEVDRPDGVIRGVVTGPDGKPLAEAWVSLHVGVEDLLEGRMNRRNAGGSRMVRVESTDEGGGEAGAIAPVLTDASGRFEVTGLARIPMTVVAEADGGKLRGQALKVVPDASITIQALGLTELRGTVKASVPITWFNVALEGPTREQRGFASPDGSFSFGRVDPGAYRVVVTSNAGNGEAQVTIQPGQPATVEVTLLGNAFVVGKLVDAGGKPVTGLPLTIIPDPGDGPMRISIEGPPITSNPDGTFRLEAKAGPSALVVLGGQGPAATRKGLILEAGKTTDVGVITVGESGPPEPP